MSYKTILSLLKPTFLKSDAFILSFFPFPIIWFMNSIIAWLFSLTTAFYPDVLDQFLPSHYKQGKKSLFYLSSSLSAFVTVTSS